MILSKASRNYYVSRGNQSPLCTDALALCAKLSKAGTDVGVGLCLKNARIKFDAPSLAVVDPKKYPDGGTAAEAFAYEAAKNPDPTHGWYNPPAGVPVFWSGGSAGAGHVAISDGKGNVWSTDIERSGKWDLVPVADIHARWGLKYLGWSERLNGVRVYV